MITRFKINIDDSIQDTETGEIYHFKSEIVKLLNEQETDKIECRMRYNNLKHKIKNLADKIV